MEPRFVRATRGNHEAAGRLMEQMSDAIDLPSADEKNAVVDRAPPTRNQVELLDVVQDSLDPSKK